MNLFRLDLNTLRYEDIEEFAKQGIPESTRLDYKRELSERDPEKQVAKGLSALANTQGGILVYGIPTKGKYPVWPSPGMKADPDFERKVIRWAIEHVDPPLVPSVGYVEHPADNSKAFAVVRVEASQFTPHTTDGGTNIYVRRADNSDPLRATFHEIELLRNQRERARKLEESHVADMRTRMGMTLPPPERCLFMVLTPIFSEDDAIPKNRLGDAAFELTKAGFKLRRWQSYSHGVTTEPTENPGWISLLSSRGCLAVRYTHRLADEDPKQPINLADLLSWALLAGEGVRVLSDHAGYWGDFRVVFESYGCKDLPVTDPPTDRYPYSRCVDGSISINQQWSVSDIKDDFLYLPAKLFWQMLWAYGQSDNLHLWDDSAIRSRLISRHYEGSCRHHVP